jgi:hypothetical protein
MVTVPSLDLDGDARFRLTIAAAAMRAAPINRSARGSHTLRLASRSPVNDPVSHDMPVPAAA